MFVNPTATSPQNAPSHSSQHINIKDAVAAVQAKLGVDGEAVTSSIDYLLMNTSSVDPDQTSAAQWICLAPVRASYIIKSTSGQAE